MTVASRPKGRPRFPSDETEPDRCELCKKALTDFYYANGVSVCAICYGFKMGYYGVRPADHPRIGPDVEAVEQHLRTNGGESP